MSIARDVALASTGGVLIALSFPRSSVHPLVWVGFVPLLLALRGKTLACRLGLGLITGVAGYCAAFPWLWESSARFFNLEAASALPFFLLFLLWHGVQLALFAACIRQPAAGLWDLLMPPCAWVVLETYFPALFPWQLANALHSHLAFVQLADVTGPSGISFAIVLVNVLIADAWQRARAQRRWLPRVGLVLSLIVALHAYGTWRLHHLDRTGRDGPTFNVLLIQGNRPAMHGTDAAVVGATLRLYAQLTQEATGTDHDLIIWPEATVRSSLLTDAAARESVLAVAERSGTPLLFGAMAETEDREQSNSAWLISPHGDLLGSYTKARPLPFAEYRPEPLSFLRRWWPSPQPAAGVEGSMFLLPEVRLAPSICYEATFPGFFRPAVRRGADLLLNLTNDVWFGDSSAPYQHLQAAAMRAVESRRWLVRAANSGVSAIIDPSGRIVSQVPLQTQGALRGTVVLLRSDTLYTRGGNWFVHLCLGAMLARWLCRRLPWKRAGRGRSLRCATGC